MPTRKSAFKNQSAGSKVEKAPRNTQRKNETRRGVTRSSR